LTNIGTKTQDISEYIPGKEMVFNYYACDNIEKLMDNLSNKGNKFYARNIETTYTI
jgi:hypothetical protein